MQPEPAQPPIEGHPALIAEIRRLIEREGAGRITFARFMREALYHPRYGYYLSSTARPGRAGDFLTAPEAHPMFGWTLAQQLVELWQRLDRPDDFTLREYGAGTGTLALAVLEALREKAPELLAAIRYQPVEINPARRADLLARLAAAGFARQIDESAEREPLRGVVLANEFLDAFPVHRVERRDGALREVYVVWDACGRFAEELGPLSTPRLAAYLAAGGIELAEGQRAEINLDAPDWIARIARTLERGYVLIIDYGYRAGELYRPERASGTLKAYHRHTLSEDPFLAVGAQDLTAHVDFSALERAALAHGLTVLGLTTQADFLAGAGIGDLLVELQHRPGMTLEQYLAARAAVMRLIDPGAMGRFRVLVLGRQVPLQPALSGLLGPDLAARGDAGA